MESSQWNEVGVGGLTEVRQPWQVTLFLDLNVLLVLPVEDEVDVGNAPDKEDHRIDELSHLRRRELQTNYFNKCVKTQTNY